MRTASSATTESWIAACGDWAMPPKLVMANRDNRLNISAGGTCQLVDLKQALDYSQTEARRELVITIQLLSAHLFHQHHNLGPLTMPFHHKHYQATCGR